MSTYIFDIDGTLVEHHTNKWLPGALEILERLDEEGHDIILITKRCEERDKGEEWSPERTRETLESDLKSRGISYRILYDVDSPRRIYDDVAPFAYSHDRNEGW